MRRAMAAVAVLGGVGLAWGAAWAQAPAEDAPRFSMRVVATGLAHPWEIAWGPDGWLWVTERTGKRVTRIDPATGATALAAELPDVHQSAPQDGLLGLALDPDLLRGVGRDFVYLSDVYDADPGPGLRRRLRVRRFTYDPSSGRLGAPQGVLTGLPAHDDHVSGRLVAGPDGTLYLGIGDQGANWLQNYCRPNRAQVLPTAVEVATQDWTAYEGKILRLNRDGSIPADNPVLDGVRSHVFSYGHRNPQGLAFGPDGRLYSSEHGPSTDDEVNLVLPGLNYGWPFVAGLRDDRAYVYANWSASSPEPCASLKFSATDLPASVPRQAESAWEFEAFQPPLMTFFTVPEGADARSGGPWTIAPSSLDVYPASAEGVPGWGGTLLVPSLTGGRLYRVQSRRDAGSDRTTIVGEALTQFRTVNRYRDLAVAPDGRTLFIATDSDGRTMDASGAFTQALANPGAILAFEYVTER